MERAVRNYIRASLVRTGREGTDTLLATMEDIGFFDAPCSGGHHLSVPGGLAKHTKNVITLSQKIGKLLLSKEEYEDMKDSIVIAAACHDLGKCGQYGKAYYVANMIKDGRPTKANPEQKYKQSEAKPWEINKDLLHLDHCVRSAVIASQCMELTEEEQFAVLYHDGLYGIFKYEIIAHETPLMLILHWADFWASHVTEDKGGF